MLFTKSAGRARFILVPVCLEIKLDLIRTRSEISCKCLKHIGHPSTVNHLVNKNVFILVMAMKVISHVLRVRLVRLKAVNSAKLVNINYS